MSNKATAYDLLYSKIPPQSREAEELVLGALLIEKDAIIQVSSFLFPEMLYVDTHAEIYKVILKLHSNSTVIDLLSVTEQLRKESKLEECGGAYFLSQLTNKIASSANIEYHARIIVQKFIQRDLIRISNDIIRDAYEDTTDVFDLLDNAELSLMKINNSINSSNIITAQNIVGTIKKEIVSPPEQPLYVMTTLGIKYNYGTVSAIGAKPATGKTALMIQSNIETAIHGINSGIFSLELKNRLLTPKMIHQYKGVSSSKIIENTLSAEETECILSDSFDPFSRIFIDDKPLRNVNIRSRIISMVSKHKVKIIWIDYIQLVTLIKDKNTTDVKAMEDLMNILQETAKELDIAIVVLSQMKRGWEKPTVEELRGGGIEAACSKVYLMYDEYAKENDGKRFLEIMDINKRGKIELIDGKSRFGDKESKSIYYDKIKQTMTDWDAPRPGEFLNEFEQMPKQEKFDVF